MDEPIPAGLCQCGCGKQTRKAPYSSARVGWIRGKWTRFVLGHNLKTTPRYEIDPQTGCWNTTGGKTKLGYGKITHNRRTLLLHRWMYEQLIGPIPVGKQLHHMCRNESCCNPAHLLAVTRKEHRHIDSAKLTESDVREILLLGSAGSIPKAEIARRFNISPRHVRNILQGKRQSLD